MAIVTSQMIQNYYTRFKDIEITLTKDVSSTLGLIKNQVYLKIGGSQWPCVLYSSSFNSAKILMSLKGPHLEEIRTKASLCNLHLGFKIPDKLDPITFYVSSRIKGLTKYVSKSPDLYFLNIEFHKRPPDDLIELIGRFLETNINAHKRSEERIPWNNENAFKLGLNPQKTGLAIDGILRKCLLRDISFGGCKALVPGLAKFLPEKNTVLRLDMKDGASYISIIGKILRADPVEDRKDIAVVAIQFYPSKVPMEYKTRLNDFLKTNKPAQESEG